MARAQGARAQMALAFETIYGTPPVGGFTKMPFASTSLGAEQPLLNSELLGYGRDPLAPIKDAVTADGRPPMPLETMLRIYFLQQWYALSDPMAEEMLYDSDAMRQFADIELGDDRIPDETTILNFRHLLEKHQLTEALFVEVNTHLADQGITLRSGTLVDATIIDAPSSTKSA
jgi:hypothetical protein